MVTVGGGQTFTAIVNGTTNRAVTWAVQEGDAGGSITPGGTYTAPLIRGTYHVVVISQADPTKSAVATVTVTTEPVISVAIDPSNVSLPVRGTQLFTALVSGGSGMGVTWSVLEGPVGGSVTPEGVYTAADTVDTFHVVATSQADPTKSAMATVSVGHRAGAPDETFGGSGVVVTDFGPRSGVATALALQPDGKIVAAGYSVSGAGRDVALARYHPDGVPDSGFGTNGLQVTGLGSGDDAAYAVALQPDGKIVVAGSAFNGTDDDFALARYLPDGTPDTGFGQDGKVVTAFGGGNNAASAMTIQEDGEIVVAGYASNGTDRDFALVRYTAGGIPDATFGNRGVVTTDFGNGDDTIHAVALQTVYQSNSGIEVRIVAAGSSFNGSNRDFALARYHPDGSLDLGFGTGGKVRDSIGRGDDLAYGLAVRPDGRIVAGGVAQNGGSNDFAVARYHLDGTPDTGFGSEGRVITGLGAGDDVAYSLALQPDERVVMAGSSREGTGSDFALARYNADGSLDAGFGAGGKITTAVGLGDDVAYAVAVQGDGRIVAAGAAGNGADTDFALARYYTDDTLDSSAGTGGFFTLSVTPTVRTIAPGFSTTYVATVTSENGFDAAVSLSCAPSPANLYITCGPSGTVVAPVGGRAQFTFTVRAAATIPTGTYVLTIRGVSGRQSASPSVSFTIALPDLVITQAQVVPGTRPWFQAGDTFSLTNTVYNQGPVSTGSFAVGYRLSLNGSFGNGNDIVLPARSVNGLGAGASQTDTTALTIPAGLSPGSYYVCVYADSADRIPEGVESNNALCSLFTILVGGPDLVPTALTVRDSGVDLVIDDAVKNVGNFAAGPFTIKFYLSSDNLYQPGIDTFLCSRSIGSLAIGMSNPPSGTATSTCPAPAVPPGSYYVLAFDDADNTVAESLETNNTRVATSKVSLGPDLVPSGLTATLSGPDIVINHAAKNQGNRNAGAFTIGFYLSTDTIYQSTDRFICSRDLNPLAAGASDPATGTTVATCPAPPAAPGAYYVIAWVDSGGAVTESLETNNTRATPSKVNLGPDLIPTSVTAVISGANLVITDSVKNQGTEGAGPFTISFYLSPDTFLGGDTLICTRTVVSLAVGVSDPAAGTVITTCPTPAVAAGSYYVIVSDDSAGAVAESLEMNNTRATAARLDIGPDLTPTAVTAATSGTNLVITDSVKNQGTEGAGPFTISFYLSSDAVLGGDTFICSRTVASLVAGASDPATGTVTTPCPVPAIAPGLYYVLVRDDSGGTVSESVESNNTRATAARLGVGPDLIPQAVTASASGGSITLNDAVKNQGNADAGAFTISFYLSSDTFLASGDVLICTRSVASLAAGASDPATGTAVTTCPIPAVAPGGYYVIVSDDSAGGVAESVEANNTAYTASRLTIGADLTPTTVSVTKSGNTLTLADQVKNQGNVNAGGFTVSFYLSLDAFLGSGDTFICSRSVPSLAAGASDPATGTATSTCSVPSGVATGNSYVIVNDDSGAVIPETVETNNTRATGGAIAVP